MSRIATAENAANHEIIVVATMPYDFQLRSDRTVRPPRDCGGHFIFVEHGIILMETLYQRKENLHGRPKQ